MSDTSTIVVALGVMLALLLAVRRLLRRRPRPLDGGALERRFDELSVAQQRAREQSSF